MTPLYQIVSHSGLTVAELARLASLKPATVYSILNGYRPDPRISTYRALCVPLGGIAEVEKKLCSLKTLAGAASDYRRRAPKKSRRG